MADDFDVIVVGSGITGGWAAKEFCEKGFKTLVLERGRHLEHPDEEYTDMLTPWELYNRGLVPESVHEQGNYLTLKPRGWNYKSHLIQFFANDKEYPYSSPKDRPFRWTRGYQLGGRSITWGRQSYRWGPKDFQANKKDGHGIPWPIGYEDLAPWYDYVENFVGVSGNKDGLPDLPDGDFLKPWEMSCAEQHVSDNLKNTLPEVSMVIGRCANLSETREVHQSLGRGPCQARNHCMRGCSFGAYFCSLSATLPAAQQAGNLTVVTDAIVASIDHNDETGRAEGVNVIDRHTGEKITYKARVIFLCASALGSVHIMLNSKSRAFPNGIANSSGMLGHYILDHFGFAGASGVVEGFEDRYSFGRRPTGFYIPNFRHEQSDDVDFIRGYGFQGSGASRPLSPHKGKSVGVGKEAKADARKDQPWRLQMGMFGEMLPYFDNQATLHPKKTDQWGIPQLHIDAYGRENERKMLVQAAKDAEKIFTAGGCSNVKSYHSDPDAHIMLGARTHEMGGAAMGENPKNSVLNKWAQSHDVPNLFVTDGAAMASCATQNPSLTYMAITARAANYAAEQMKNGLL